MPPRPTQVSVSSIVHSVCLHALFDRDHKYELIEKVGQKQKEMISARLQAIQLQLQNLDKSIEGLDLLEDKIDHKVQEVTCDINEAFEELELALQKKKQVKLTCLLLSFWTNNL